MVANNPIANLSRLEALTLNNLTENEIKVWKYAHVFTLFVNCANICIKLCYVKKIKVYIYRHIR